MPSVRKPHLLSTRSWIAAALCAALLVIVCTNEEPSDLEILLDLVPDLPVEFAQCLVAGDDSTLVEYAKQVGSRQFSRSRSLLADALPLDSYDAYEQHFTIVWPYYCRAIAVENVAFGTHYIVDYDLKPSKRNFKEKRIRKENREIIENPDLTDIEKIEKLKELLIEARQINDPWRIAQIRAGIASCYLNIGNVEEATNNYVTALAGFRNVKHYNMQCQILGVLGVIYGDRGQIDSMVVCWEEAKKLARDNVLTGQVARIHTFYASYYQKLGRLSLAHDLFDEALDVCRREKIGFAGLGFWVRVMNFHADLGAWEIIGRLLPQARAIEGKEHNEHFTVQNTVGLSFRKMEARYLMAMGRVDEAQGILEEIKKPVDDLPGAMHYPVLLHDWAEGLIENNRIDEAIPLIREGYKRCEEMNKPEWAARFFLFMARAWYEQGDMKASIYALGQFEQRAAEFQDDLQHEWSTRDVLRIKICLSENEHSGAVKALADAMARHRGLLARTDASVHGYLWISKCNELRQLLHDDVASDPLLGYGIESYWRDSYRWLESANGAKPGGSQPAAVTPGDKRAEGIPLHRPFREHAETMKALVTKKDAIHCVYLLRDNEVWRWTCSRSSMRRDVLDITTNELKELVSTTRRKMCKDPENPEARPQPELVRDLRTLARVLLPDEVLDKKTDGPSRTFLVSVDGFLAQFPFETLNVDNGADYAPLLAERDVAYIRHAGESRAGTNTAPGIIVANTQGSRRFSDRYVFGRDLEAVYAEGKAVSSQVPGSRFLHGDSATKSNLLAEWEDASFVYFATHVIRDPDVPYVVMIPMANPGGSLTLEASCLDISSIRRADFARCGVVVLSGCSSGVPYLDVRTQSPSLGDAFLDAGAETVIQTFRDVGDAEARALMAPFTSELGTSTSASALIKALCNSRRAMISGKAGVRHPYNWAAYCIKISRL